jgi:hypothetical protein
MSSYEPNTQFHYKHNRKVYTIVATSKGYFYEKGSHIRDGQKYESIDDWLKTLPEQPTMASVLIEGPDGVIENDTTGGFRVPPRNKSTLYVRYLYSMIRKGAEHLLNDEKVAAAYNALADYVMENADFITSFVPRGKNKFRILRNKGSLMQGFHATVEYAIKVTDGKNVICEVDENKVSTRLGELYVELYDLIYDHLVHYILKMNGLELKKQYIRKYSNKIKNLRKRIDDFQADVAFYVGEVEMLRCELDNIIYL